MTSFKLEQIRDNMAMVEQLEKSVVQCLFVKTEQPKESVLADHRIKIFVDMA